MKDLELTPREEQLLLVNSVERVINTSMDIALHSKHRNAHVNYDDWEELKWLIVKMFNHHRNEVFVKRNPT